MTAKQYAGPVLAIVLGMALIAGSIVWSRLPASAAVWTPEQAEAYEKAAQDFHRMASSPPTPENEEPRRQAEQRYQQLRSDLEDARGGSAWIGMVLQMLGVGLGLVGSVWLILRQNQAED